MIKRANSCDLSPVNAHGHNTINLIQVPKSNYSIIASFIFLSNSIKMSYQAEYSKNKTMYTKLRYTIMLGGGKNIVIHISGPSAAGKTTLGEQLEKKFGNSIVVKDTDELWDDFFNQPDNKDFLDHKAYQSYIDRFVNKQKKPLVFTGLNVWPWDDSDKKVYYDMHSDYNYYIQIDDMEVVKLKCIRFITEALPDIVKSEQMTEKLMTHNEEAVATLKSYIEHRCGTEYTLRMNKMWNHDYKKMGYKFMSREKIFEKVSQILEKKLKKH